MRQIRVGSTQRKLLILLSGGLSLSLSHNPRRQFRILKQMEREWEKVNQQSLRRAIRGLYESKLVDYKENADGAVTIILHDEGRKKALTYKIEDMKIKKPEKWDGRWYIIIFDIPERFKKVREALRYHLRKLGFHQLQKSAFVLPYECRNEIDFLMEVYNIRAHVRQIVADHIDNELHLKKIFRMLN